MSSFASKKKSKKAKAKAKKEARRLEKQAELARRATVRSAMFSDVASETPRNALLDSGFGPDSPFTNFAKNGLSVRVSFATAADLAEADMQAIFDLTKTNMHAHYCRAAEVDPSDWTWSDRKKMAELKDPEARYLVARQEESGPIVAFAHFRFEIEGLYTVLYVYELQIAESVQKKGLGKRFMQLLELIGVKQGMQWVMLTVFKGNNGAGSFYERLKYEIDEIDPSLSEEGAMDVPAPYSILSKCSDKEEKKRLAAIKLLNEAVAKDIAEEEEEAAANAKSTAKATTPMKTAAAPKMRKVSP